MKIIDVSSNNSVSDVTSYGSEACIVKVSQGTWYVNPKCNDQVAATVSSGQLLGLYHYAEGGNPVAEADYFYNQCKNYIDKAVVSLDWEQGENKSWGNKSWAKQFADRILQLTGKNPIIYVQASAIWQVANCSSTCGLWVAGYPDNRDSWNAPTFSYNISPWSYYTLWQYSSSGGRLDRSIGNLDSDGWRAIAGRQSTGNKPQPPVTNEYKDVERLANETIWGMYGSGDDRKNALGSKYGSVQAVTNYALGTINNSTLNTLLSKEIRIGNCGVGNDRKHFLGRYYDQAQKYVDLGK